MNLPQGYPYAERKIGFEWTDRSRIGRRFPEMNTGDGSRSQRCPGCHDPTQRASSARRRGLRRRDGVEEEVDATDIPQALLSILLKASP